MRVDVIHSAATPGQRIHTLHAWIATYADGTEGIIACDLPGLGMTPLISSRRPMAEALEPAARQAQQAVMRQMNMIITIRLVTFNSAETKQESTDGQEASRHKPG